MLMEAENMESLVENRRGGIDNLLSGAAVDHTQLSHLLGVDPRYVRSLWQGHIKNEKDRARAVYTLARRYAENRAQGIPAPRGVSERAYNALANWYEGIQTPAPRETRTNSGSFFVVTPVN